jgi:hypothetical protein
MQRVHFQVAAFAMGVACIAAVPCVAPAAAAGLITVRPVEAPKPEAGMVVPKVDVKAPVDVPPPSPAPASNALPPMNFYASVAGEELLAAIKASPAFQRLDKDLPGSPVVLRVTHAFQPTAGGQAAGFMTALLAGSTLGLLPVVTNNNLVLVYEVRVNGKTLLRQDFQRSFTRASAIWNATADDPTHGLGADGLEWAKSTATEFAGKAAQDASLVALQKEYAFYFGPVAN